MSHGSYYSPDSKRVEIIELKQLLNSVRNNTSDYTQQREAIQKVIALMTLGIDVSHLFSEMVMAASSPDVVQKKMIYLYMSTYAESNPSLCLLAVNTLLKDCSDHDPTIRGLALKSLCSLNVSNILEYLEPAVRRGLSDISDYVRSIAVMGVLRIFHVLPESVIGNSEIPKMETEEEISGLYEVPSDPASEPLLRILFALLNDIQPNVVCNTIFVLNEILALQGGLPVTQKLIVRLLNRIKQFRDASQCIILNLLSQYIPANENEIYDIMNILEDQLKHSSPAILLATTRCFLALTNYCVQNRLSVLKRLRAPFLTFLAAASPELSYVLFLHLKHMLVVLDNENYSNKPDLQESEFISVGAQVFGNDYRLFFCGLNDPRYIKMVKIDLLCMTATQKTAPFILDELAEYVIIDHDCCIVERSVGAMGRIASQFSSFRQTVTEQMLRFIGLNIENVASSCFLMLRHLVMEDTQIFSLIKDSLEKQLLLLKNPKAIASCLWMLGNYGVNLPNAPYLLEDLLLSLFCNFTDSETLTPCTLNGSKLRLKDEMRSDDLIFELITVATRLLIARPPEMQRTAGRLFFYLLGDDEISFDVRDRILFLYRFLREVGARKSLGLLALQSLLKPFTVQTDSSRQHRPPLLNQLYQPHSEPIEFNTLSLVFGLTPERFLTTSRYICFNGRFIPPRSFVSQCSTSALLRSSHAFANFSSKHNTSIEAENNSVETAQPKIIQEKSLLHEAETKTLETDKKSMSLNLVSNDQELFDPISFESLWIKASTSYKNVNHHIHLDPQLLASKRKLLETVRHHLLHAQFHCIASGSPSPDLYKWFCYGVCSSPSHTVILLECQFTLSPKPTFHLELKMDPSESLSVSLVLDWLRRSSTFLSSLIPP